MPAGCLALGLGFAARLAVSLPISTVVTSIASIASSFALTLPFAFGGLVRLVGSVGCEHSDPTSTISFTGLGAGGSHGRRGSVVPLEDAAVPDRRRGPAAGVATQPQANGLPLPA